MVLVPLEKEEGKLLYFIYFISYINILMLFCRAISPS